ncbi:arylamine N-acetyltransferase [Streptomyces sp. NBC_00091]|uniref:arylamine N-acetyltransferase family protein n=1 Tax=Streptomyces sp. NBC_00091 TaxID=2975648 RepID=UPI0022516B14|nr:arylamine N-acetyltransferase [Streptomyces sp. NBC_00091]MCX5377620.1 arylamine N-acetyltransferase [Streptomyces sp. NBC_00091]
MTNGMYTDYLRRLGITDPGAPSAEGLFALQRAHLERIAYDNIDIQLGRPPGIDPELSVRRFSAGRGGYCFHLNGAFAALLEHLGYEVTRHLGGVEADAASRVVNGQHLTLTVRVGGAAYWVDAGLGDGPYEPLPLREGAYEQGGFRYAVERLEPLEGEGPGWSLFTPFGHLARVNLRDAPATTADFEETHTWLSTSPDSPFVRTLALFRCDAEGMDVLRGRVLSRVAAAKPTTERELAGPQEFFEVLAGVFGRDLGDLTQADREALWAKVDRAHGAWLASRDAKAPESAGASNAS